MPTTTVTFRRLLTMILLVVATNFIIKNAHWLQVPIAQFSDNIPLQFTFIAIGLSIAAIGFWRNLMWITIVGLVVASIGALAVIALVHQHGTVIL